MDRRKILILAKRRYWYTNKIRNPRGEGGVVGTVGVTNKCTGYNAKPPALVAPTTLAAFNSAVTNAYGSGGDGATLFGVVDGTAGLQAIAASDPFIAAGLANGWHNGRVFEVDNTSGAATAYLVLNGPTANTNTHSFSLYGSAIVGTGALRFNSVDYTTIAGAPFARYKKEALTPIDGTRLASVAVFAGAKIRVTLFDLIEASTAAPVPTVVAGAAATGALPTNMSISNGLTYGLSLAFLGQTTIQGLPAFQVRYIGTANASNTIYIGSDVNTYAAAAAGQAWGADFLVSLANGSMNGATVKSVMSEYAGAPYLRTLAIGANVAPTIVPSRVSSSGVAISSAITSVNHFFGPNVTNATVYDFTLNFIASKLVQIAVIEGSELVTNGDFASATGWTLDANVAIAAGQLTVTSGTSGQGGAQTVATVTGQTYKLSHEITSTAGSSTRLSLEAVVGATRTTVGSFVDYLVAAQTNPRVFIKGISGSNTFSADNLSLKLVTPGYMPSFPILPPVGVPGDSSALL